VVLDYTTTGLSLRAHPVAFARQRLKQRGVRPTGDLKDTASTPAGSSISVAGLVLMRQRPSTANDVTFITIEDESGIANLIVSKGVYQRYRRAASSRLLIARGRVQRQGLVVHVMVTSLVAFDEMLSELKVEARDFR